MPESIGIEFNTEETPVFCDRSVFMGGWGEELEGFLKVQEPPLTSAFLG
jgi:hypothetical protein